MLEEVIKEKIIANEDKNIDNIELNVEPEYELKLVNKSLKTNKEEIIEEIKNDVIITYKYYEIALNNEKVDLVNTIEEAEELIQIVKEKNEGQELDLTILEKYTQDVEEVMTTNIEIAKNEIQTKITEKLEEDKEQKEMEEKTDKVPAINGIKLAVVPVSGTITSRFAVVSRIRSGAHTGLDISAPAGTPIKVVASGRVTFSGYSGAYGNIVKVDHGNGVETWYAHCSKLYVQSGQTVSAGDIIGAVGSTGNSTGNHLHLEIRINGVAVNPQNYLYK